MNNLMIAIRGKTYAAVADSVHRLVRHDIQGALVDTVTDSLGWPLHSAVREELDS